MDLSASTEVALSVFARTAREVQGVQLLGRSYMHRLDGNVPVADWHYWRGVRDLYAALHGLAPETIERMCAATDRATD
jgi:hypothetical protein